MIAQAARLHGKDDVQEDAIVTGAVVIDARDAVAGESGGRKGCRDGGG